MTTQLFAPKYWDCSLQDYQSLFKLNDTELSSDVLEFPADLKLPYADHAFDTVLCNAVEFSDEQIISAVSELTRVAQAFRLLVRVETGESIPTWLSPAMEHFHDTHSQVAFKPVTPLQGDGQWLLMSATQVACPVS